METKSGIIKNYFSPEQEQRLRDIVEENRKLPYNSSRFAPMIIEEMSRMQIEFIVPEDIEQKLLETAKEFVDDPDLELTHFQYLDYYGKYGNGKSPKLPPHLDTENYYTKISIDYQMNSNIDWAVVVEGEKFTLRNGEVLVFEAADRIHWRDPIKLKPEDRSEVIVFHFSNKYDHQPYKENQMSLEERNMIIKRHNDMPRMQKYRKQFQAELDKLEGN